MAVSDATRRLVRERALHRCEYSHADERWQFVRFPIDHITPRSDAGSDEPDNLALACRNGNERRSNRTETVDPETGETTALFHPRQNTWSDHFSWDAGRLRIVGWTPTGRETLAALDMNDDNHEGRVIAIRQRDLADGYHPPPSDPVLNEL